MAISMGIAADAGAVPAGSARSGLVLSPTTGALVRSGVVRIAVRSGDQSRALSVHLNGVSLGGSFGLSRRGVRTLDASISQGLRRGRNVLRVKVSPFGRLVRTATVRFTVKNTGPLVGAGSDRLVVVGDLSTLRGRVPSLRGTHPHTPIHWQLLPKAGGTANASSATVSHPNELDAGFRATALGRRLQPRRRKMRLRRLSASDDALACWSRERGQLGCQLHVPCRAGASALDAGAVARDRRRGAPGTSVGVAALLQRHR